MIDSAPDKDFKYTRQTLKKIETMFREASFKVRYEKGNFQSGYCLLEDHQIAVVNKFFDVEARTLCLLEILEKSPLDLTQLTESSVALLKKLVHVFELEIDLDERLTAEVEGEQVTETTELSV